MANDLGNFLRTTRKASSRGRAVSLDVQRLEGRALMSRGGIVVPPRAAEVAPIIVGALASSGGAVRKAPAFSADYLGVKRADLNLVAASATLKNGKTLTLSATVQGKLIRKPTGPAQEAFFVFAIDRSSPQTFALFPTRPNILYDAVVVVTITKDGTGAYLADSVTGARTDLAPKSVRVSGKTVQVDVAASLFATPSGVKPLSQARFGVWARSVLVHGLADADDFVASFLPENGNAPIGVKGRR
ncbi:MAG: hypothetical protein JWN86_2622 [Planctomycetota bacterium]|nr:hypothetical protein [Planctomycetota bacterium]